LGESERDYLAGKRRARRDVRRLTCWVSTLNTSVVLFYHECNVLAEGHGTPQRNSSYYAYVEERRNLQGDLRLRLPTTQPAQYKEKSIFAYPTFAVIS
jgi:hypothetical protein